ncbi:MAG: amidohydrolase family protein [Clostridia bacterium]|nr:amidohydrolase family protein [Clostridia bacterium]
MNEFTLIGKAVIAGKVVEDAAVAVSDSRIIYAGEKSSAPKCGETVTVDGWILPGFIDIHCHAGDGVWVHNDLKTASDFHLKHGTTTMCATLYRDLGFEGLRRAIEKITDEMPHCPNVMGIHLEGPYLNPKYGALSRGGELVADPEDYLPLLNYPTVRHVTFAPEVCGTDEFLSELVSRKIVPSVGHSAASPEDIRRVSANGVKNVTHLFDATGASYSPTRWAGTIETDFNTAVLIEDGLTYEIICDKDGIHVRPEMVKLVKKTVGADRIIGITDACGDDGEGEEINILNGELNGSKLTMNRVARNFYNLGFTMPEVVKVTSENAARLMGIFDRKGSLEAGKDADIVTVDDSFNVINVYKS